MSEMKRNTYIENNDDEQALQDYLQALGDLQGTAEEISVLDAVGRITWQAIFARFCDPVYNASAMDGIAVIAEQTFSATETEPLTLKPEQDFVYVNTGNEIKPPFNAVIMIEQVLKHDDGTVSIIAPAYPWEHVRTVGESIVSGDLILPSRHKIRPIDLGALLAGGITKVQVYRKPTVGIIPTGNELIEDPDKLEPGRLMESNSRVFAALTEEYGGQPNRYGIVHDSPDLLRAAIRKAVEENDMVIVNAGSSAGSKDYTVHIIEELGEVIHHGIAIKPGKPTILGVVQGKPVIGIPGYPVSAYLVFDLFLRPLIYRMTGQSQQQEQYVEATLTKRLVSSFKNAELLRVALGYVNGRLVTTPLNRGAAAVMSMVKADGIVKVERLCEGLEVGETVQVRLLRPLNEIKNTLVITGSHDMMIDVLADQMAVSSAHVGSLSGIMALRRKECHMAPIHLLDEATGVYNEAYVRQYFPNQKMVLIRGVGRIQGFMVPKGNPKQIAGIEDLKQRRVTFANRQRGAGTRILFDYTLKQQNMAAEEINGYEKEYATHMAVAISVKSGVADTGLGVYSAAKAMDLDFIPLANEQYDFLVPAEYLEDPRVQQFIGILSSSHFKQQLLDLGGYDVAHTGEIQIIE
ncbi:molybdopterin biosynthesis protein [Peptococcaceae bacterium]